MPDAAPSPLADLALLCVVVAHGMDGDLDASETVATVQQLEQLGDLGESDLMQLVETAVERYGEVKVSGLDDVVARLGRALSPDDRTRAHAALAAVADADGIVHTMERTLIRHIAQAWGVTSAGPYAPSPSAHRAGGEASE